MFVGLGTTFPLIASMAHLLTAFSWANEDWMNWMVAIATVLLNVLFVILWVLSREKIVRRAIFCGMMLMLLVEFFGNFSAGGLIAMKMLPAEISTLFLGLDRNTAIWLGTFLFAAFLPILNFISVFALSEAGLRLLKQSEDRRSNTWAQQLLDEFNQPNQPTNQNPTGATPASGTGSGSFFSADGGEQNTAEELIQNTTVVAGKGGLSEGV